MEGWLYGLFTLLGVLLGGLFTYLGLRDQLKQQKQISTIEWKRKVRSDPLLKLRVELAEMAMKQEKLVFAAQTVSITGSEDAKNDLSQALKEWTAHIHDYNRNIFQQYDAEIVNIVKEISGSYSQTWIYAMEEKFTLKKINKILKTCEKNETKIIEAQELINKRLEEL